MGAVRRTFGTEVRRSLRGSPHHGIVADCKSSTKTVKVDAVAGSSLPRIGLSRDKLARLDCLPPRRFCGWSLSLPPSGRSNAGRNRVSGQKNLVDSKNRYVDKSMRVKQHVEKGDAVGRDKNVQS